MRGPSSLGGWHPAFRSEKKKKAGTTRVPDGFAVGFEQYGSFAGPPSRPEPLEVSATSLLLSWEPPQHLGGSGFEVISYQVLIQYCGEGGFTVHIPDTGTGHSQCIVEDLAPDAWHEFQVRAITTAGTGAPSASSRPVLTERAPALLRELRAAEALLAKLKDRLKRRRDELLSVARSGTMALRLGSASGGAAAAGSSDGEQPGPSQPRLSAAETKREVRRRKRLEEQVADLEERVASHELHVRTLQATQAGTDAARRAALSEAAGFVGAYGSGELGSSMPAPNVLSMLSGLSASPAPAAAGSSAAYGSSPLDTAPNTTTRSFGGPMVVDGADRVARRARSPAEDMRRLRSMAAYSKLVAEDEAEPEETYAPFHREAVRMQLDNALSRHVLADDPAGERRHYFHMALNRARSAMEHNVFDRFGDWELEQLVLLFARFDQKHDGVLEFHDFCRVMLVVGSRVGAVYHQTQLVRMFDKADLNGDKLLDLNEFLWLARHLDLPPLYPGEERGDSNKAEEAAAAEDVSGRRAGRDRWASGQRTAASLDDDDDSVIADSLDLSTGSREADSERDDVRARNQKLMRALARAAS